MQKLHKGHSGKRQRKNKKQKTRPRASDYTSNQQNQRETNSLPLDHSQYQRKESFSVNADSTDLHKVLLFFFFFLDAPKIHSGAVLLTFTNETTAPRQHGSLPDCFPSYRLFNPSEFMLTNIPIMTEKLQGLWAIFQTLKHLRTVNQHRL